MTDQTTETTEVDETVATEETSSTTEETTAATTDESTGSENTADETTSNETEVETESTDEVEAQSTTTDDQAAEADVRVVPEVDAYTLPEGVPIQVAQFASENDMTQAQLDTTLQYFGGYMQATEKGQQAFLKEQGEATVESWGDKKEYNLALVRRALSQNDPDGALKDMLNTTGYGNHPAVLAFFLKIGNSMKEGGFLKGSVNRPVGKKTRAQTMFGSTHPSVN